MPTYQYRCTDCNDNLEIVQKFTDPTLTVCPSCKGSLRKVFNAVGVVFKGSGFYLTDSRADARKAEHANQGHDKDNGAGSSPTAGKPAEVGAAASGASKSSSSETSPSADSSKSSTNGSSSNGSSKASKKETSTAGAGRSS